MTKTATSARRRLGVASVAVLAIVAGLFTWFALNAQGETVRKADLNDGGVWVSNNVISSFGRLNKPAQQLDAGVALAQDASGSGLDVLQDGGAVLGIDAASNQATPVNASAAVLAASAALTLPKPAAATGLDYARQLPIDLRGGSVAVVDPATGKLWAQRTPTSGTAATVDQLQPQTKPLATVGGTAVVAIGTDGTVYAASAAKGEVVTLAVDPVTGGFAKPVVGKLGFTSKAVELTAVGARWVAFDPATGAIRVAGLDTALAVSSASGESGALAQAALQVPGPEAASVLVETAEGLEDVALDDTGSSSTVVTLPESARVTKAGDAQKVFLTAPVRLGDCVHAAWAGPASVWYGRACGVVKASADGEKKVPQAVQLGDLGPKATRVDGVKLRTNRGLIVLNDLDSGNLWDIDNTPLKIDNWDSVIPPPQQADDNTKKDPNEVDDQIVRTPPQAQPDELDVRPGRTSTLHVLDNDSDSSGSILGIAPGDVTQPDADGVRAAVSADGQTIDVTVPDDATGSTFAFTYKVNNGTGGANGSATGRVTVHVVGDDVNTPPLVRKGAASLARAKYSVVPGGHVTVGVVADYRDGENDPLSVEASDSGTGVDTSGALTVAAPGKPGPIEVKYSVSDGHGGTTPGTIPVTVLADDAKAVPPLTQPDAIRAVVGKPVQVEPLGNDVPGADPTDPDARMRIAAAVRGPGQLTVDTNLDTGVLTVTGAAPGTFFLTYAAQVGSAVSPGRVRVDILADPSGTPPPVAAPDAATLRGQSPVVTDVLVNDYSPRSDVLVVQKVTTSVPWLRASVVQGRYLRLVATNANGGSELRRTTVTYTVSDGTAAATGQVAIVQKPTQAAPVPDVQDDEAVVRTGDVVTVPVLDNDSVSGGIPLVLDPSSVKVVASTGGKGQAFASGSVVRYVPDATAPTADQVVTLEYGAYPEGSKETERTGRVTVTVKPLPTATVPDQPPTARSFSASVTAGDTITVTVPTSGIDPDGDLGYVTGIVGGDGEAVDLALGRVVSVGASTIRYEAYPRSAGTEVIRYSVRDRFGLASDAFVRIGIVQPGDPQPPVAVADDAVAAPGRTLTVDPLANDLIAPGDAVDYDDFTPRNEKDALAQFSRQDDATFKVTVPGEADPKVLTYGITDGLFDPSVSTVTVRGQKGFNNPPVALDDTASPKPDETATTVDVLANDRDPDGEATSLSIVSATGEGVSVVGGKVRVTLLDHPRVVPYVIEDADGAQALAVIYVPTANNGAPYVISGKVVAMKANSTADVDLAQYLVDPRGKTVTVTSPETVSTSPSSGLTAQVTGASRIRLTSKADYTGPAALMLEVTDATGPDDKTGVTAYVTVPVQVGPLTPVLRCPDYEVGLVADGPARTVDVPRLCHAWLPDGLDPGTLTYAASWQQQASRVDLSQVDGESRGSRVVLRAQPGAPAGTGTLTVAVAGTDQKFTLRVRVTEAPPLSVRPVSIDGLVAGQSRSVDLRGALSSPLSAPTCAVSAVRVVSGSGVSGTASGCTLTVTSTSAARRTAVLAFAISDAPGRVVDGQATVTIKAPPDAPVGVGAIADRIAGGQARVSWSPPPYDGGLPVLEYEVRASSGQTLACSASPCTFSGLKNGVPVSFTVRARNGVDWSPLSRSSAAVTPDTKPQAVTVGAVTPGDRTLRVTWAAPKNEGSPVDRYQVSYVNVNGGAGSGAAQVSGAALATTVSGLVNDDQYSLRVQAHNGAGWGPYGPAVTKQSVGTPATVAAPKVSARQATPDMDNASLTISWSPVDPNGPAMTQYTVYRDGTALRTVSAKAALTTADSVPYDGRTHQYSVTATNGGGKTSKAGPSTPYRASGVPEQPRVTGVSTPQPDYAAGMTFAVGNSHSSAYRAVQWDTTSGASQTVGCSPSCASVTMPTGSIQSQTARVRVQNDIGEWSPWSASSAPYQPYGPTKAVSKNGTPSRSGDRGNYTLTFRWTITTNGRPVTVKATGCSLSSNTATSCTVSAGYSETKSVTITASSVANAGTKATKITAPETPAKPKATAKVVPGSTCNHGTCDPANPSNCNNTCRFVKITTTNFDASSASCQISGGGDSFATKTIPTNTTYQTNAFYGYGATVKVVCSAGGQSATDTYTNWPP